MSYLKISLLALISLALFSCDTKSTVSNGGGGGGAKIDSKNGCFNGDPLATNLVGGTQVQVGDADQKMAVLVLGSSENSIEFCTANAIGRRVLLTAAHCISPDVATYAIALYPSITCASGFRAQRNMVSVQAVVRNKNYDDSIAIEDRRDDIGLIFLKEDLPADYPIFKIANPADINGSDMYLYGYGKTGEKLGGVGTLRRAVLPNSAITVRPESKLIQLNQQSGVGICQGDSGGAGFVKIGDEMQILGINSSVERVGGGTDLCSGYGYQTTAYEYKDWIEAAIKDNGQIPEESR